jgi:uncharacterized membrane protein YgcG
VTVSIVTQFTCFFTATSAFPTGSNVIPICSSTFVSCTFITRWRTLNRHSFPDLGPHRIRTSLLNFHVHLLTHFLVAHSAGKLVTRPHHEFAVIQHVPTQEILVVIAAHESVASEEFDRSLGQSQSSFQCNSGMRRTGRGGGSGGGSGGGGVTAAAAAAAAALAACGLQHSHLDRNPLGVSTGVQLCVGVAISERSSISERSAVFESRNALY